MGVYFANDPVADEAFVATALSRMGSIVDLISGENVVLGAFARAGLIAGINGGHTITQPLLIAESGIPTWFDGLDPVSKDFTPGVTEAEYTWSWVSHPVRMEYTTRWKNQGESRVMSIEELRFRQARKTLLNDIAQKTVNGTGGRQPVGLTLAIEAANVGAQVEVVGGINKAVHQWWNNQHLQVAGGTNFGDDVSGAASTFLARGVLNTMQLFLSCAVGTSVPRWFFCTQAMGENFLRAMAQNNELRSSGRVDPTVDPTPHSVAIFGKPVVPSPELPVDTGLWITSNREGDGSPGFQNRDGVSETGQVSARELGGVYCAYHPAVNMTLDGPRVAGGQHAEWTFFLHSKMVVYENLAQQGRLSAANPGGLDTW
jgi:hypothetical protein